MNISILAPLSERFKYGTLSHAEILKALEDLEDITMQLETVEDELFDVKKELEKQPDYDNYVSFFESCFERLNKHYPCPSITSDYDHSVIFDAIQNGDIE